MIELDPKNYKQYLPLEVAAFDFAFSGAMGDGGGVNILTRDGQHYYFNYCADEWEEEQINEVLPILPQCQFPIFGPYADMPDGYRFYSLGMGNNLVIAEDLAEQMEAIYASAYNQPIYPSILYRAWFPIVESILAPEDDEKEG